MFASARNLQHPRWPPSQPGRQHSTPPRKSQKSDFSFSMQPPHHISTVCVLRVVLNIALKEAGCKRSWGKVSLVTLHIHFKYTIRSIVCEAFCQSVTWSLGHLVTRSLGHLVTGSLCHSVSRSLGHYVTRALGH